MLPIACAVMLACRAPEPGPDRPRRPNILFIMADDHAANAIGSFGSRLSELAPTANIDRIAAEGMRLTNVFCTNSICVPSRASILTGLYSHANGVYRLSDALDEERSTVAHWLKAAGYSTAVIGKWHLKSEPRGFDHWEVLPGQGRYHDPVLIDAEGRKQYSGHSTDVITGRALRWLDERDAGRPFFLMCHFKATHEPWQYAPRFAGLFEGVDFPEPDSLFEDQAHRSAATRDRGYTIETLAARMQKSGHTPERFDATGLDPGELRRAAYQHFVRAYMRCVAGIDENVGRLLDYLDRHDLARETLVIYTSDQGYFLGEHDYIDKRWMFEESLRMPTLVRFPDEIRAGSTSDAIVLNTDFAPLFLDFAGARPPAGLQGSSFRSVLGGRTPPDWRRSMYYHYWTQEPLRPAHFGIRSRRFKLICFYGNAREGDRAADFWELYDLERDPRELRNVYTDPAYADELQVLEGDLRRLRRELADQGGAVPAR